jgi:hypothetical protein
MMNPKTPVLVLAVLAMLLVLAVGLAGIRSDDGGRVYTWVTLRGETVEIYGGDGIYRYDTLRKAVIGRGYDWTNVVVCLPLLIIGFFLYRRGQLRGALLLCAIFAYLAYNYLIGVLGNAFNEMFFLWIALFSVGLFGVALVLAGIDRASLINRLGAHFPRKSLAVYLTLLAAFLLIQYVIWVLSAYLSGTPPKTLGPYTTLELPALELGIMIPLHLIGAVLLWKRKPGGYLLGIVLAFAAFMTFVSLAAGTLALYFFYDRAGAFDIGMVITLVGIAAVFSALSLRRVKNIELPA